MPLTVRVTVAFVLIDDMINSVMILVYSAKVHCYMHRRKDVNDAPVLRLDWTKTGDEKVIGRTLENTFKRRDFSLKPKIVKLTTVSGADYQ